MRGKMGMSDGFVEGDGEEVYVGRGTEGREGHKRLGEFLGSVEGREKRKIEVENNRNGGEEAVGNERVKRVKKTPRACGKPGRQMRGGPQMQDAGDNRISVQCSKSRTNPPGPRDQSNARQCNGALGYMVS